MGIYINPTIDTSARSKRETILALSPAISSKDFLAHKAGSDDKFGIAIIDNGLFIAAGVAYSDAEARAFIDGAGGRKVDYTILTIAQIEALDPNSAAILRTHYMKAV